VGEAADDPRFTDQGSSVRYVVSTGDATGPFKVEAELWFQPIGFRWAHNLAPYDSAWCGILKARRGGPPWCWLRRRLVGKDFLKNQNANYAEVIKTWSNQQLEYSTGAFTQYRLSEVVFGGCW
jgi:hypothetical protein